MTRMVAGHGEIGNLVLRETGILRALHQLPVHLSDLLFTGQGRQFTGITQPGQRRAGFVGQLVRRKVAYGQRQRTIERGTPPVTALAGQAVNQIYGDVVHTRPHQSAHSIGGFRGIVPSPQETQLCVIKALYAKTDTIDAQCTKPGGEVVVDIVGIDLNSNLCIGRNGVIAVYRTKNPGKSGKGQERRGAATQINGVYRERRFPGLCEVGTTDFQFTAYSLHIALLPTIVTDRGIKIAIYAARFTKGYV